MITDPLSPLVLGAFVTREIPQETIAGLNTGLYRLAGGVVRYAAGSESGGQIVRHLIVPGPGAELPAYQDPLSRLLIGQAQTNPMAAASRAMSELSQMFTQQMLSMVTINMVLSGLNLAVSAVGFATLYAKLGRMDKRLKEIAVNVLAVREMLEAREQAGLLAALDRLSVVPRMPEANARRELIISAQQEMGVQKRLFSERLENADSPEAAAAFEEYYCIAALANARCFAELGAPELAAQELEKSTAFRHEHTRRLSREVLLGDTRSRLLSSDFADIVPTAAIGEIMDFVYDESRGVDWLDTLRSESAPYYPVADEDPQVEPPSESWWASISRGSAQLHQALANVSSSRPDDNFGDIDQFSDHEITDRSRDREIIVPTLRRFAARTPVLDGYVTQYQLMALHNITPTELEQQLAAVRQDMTTDGFIILDYSPADAKSSVHD